MKALIFAAGLGTRLRPLTDHLPKALVEIEGRTLLDLTIERLIKAQATEIVVNVHHFAHLIKAHLAAHHYPIPVRISDESDGLLDTGGGLRRAAALFSPTPAPILIHNVDILHNADLAAFYAAACAHDITLMVSQRQTTRYLLFDDAMRLGGWTRTDTHALRPATLTPERAAALQPFAFSGIHCVAPRVLPLMDSYPPKFPIMDFYLDHCHDLSIHGIAQPNLRLLDVGKTDTLAAAADFLSANPL